MARSIFNIHSVVMRVDKYVHSVEGDSGIRENKTMNFRQNGVRYCVDHVTREV